ncbi:uncharacterized protein LOC119552028 [Drosophila subpulchrella]|uniref:uncharacterized protein LOC119552028 n=1 Tax=Drosophila subpulchrella TaxID=1486046 RepID=UPI0018A19152|nr:uncharacterized protein LOC119552028 [Drosophila subpulchrella]
MKYLFKFILFLLGLLVPGNWAVDSEVGAVVDITLAPKTTPVAHFNFILDYLGSTTTEKITTKKEFTTTEEFTTTRYPIYRPPFVGLTTSSRIIYAITTTSPRIRSKPIEKCYLREQLEYRKIRYAWRPTTICYRCCYHNYTEVAKCSRLHQGRCLWHDYA